VDAQRFGLSANAGELQRRSSFPCGISPRNPPSSRYFHQTHCRESELTWLEPALPIFLSLRSLKLSSPNVTSGINPLAGKLRVEKLSAVVANFAFAPIPS
jgi:hypothetical protein